ncbi:MAG: dihydrodipicolinate synthase family protein [Holophaga sp.]|jgi:4-hydroxy-tetrahydrodipicolinate synthase
MTPANAPATPLRGVLAPVLTPFDGRLTPDQARYNRHCAWLLAHGCAGLAPFGTTSEANSLSLEERLQLLEGLVASGIPAARLIPGTGCCSIPETAALSAHAASLGCAGVLMLPPFYYKGMPEEGLYRHYAEVIERVGDARLRVYLYHIPPVSQVPVPPALVERLLKAYPGTLTGVKDSSGDWPNTQALLALVPAGLSVFPGSEVFLLRGLRLGSSGCITASANVNPGPIDHLYRNWQSPEAEALQAGLDQTRKILAACGPIIPTLKAVLAHFSQDPGWRTVRPPHVDLADAAAVLGQLRETGFRMPGLAF